MKHYGLLDSVSQIVLEAQQTSLTALVGFFDELPAIGEGPARPIVVNHWPSFEITIEPCLVFCKRSPTAGMVIYHGGANFLLIGWGFQVCARSLS